MEVLQLTSEIPIAEAGRLMMANELAIIMMHEPEVRATAAVAAVYEMRKAIRRTYTSYKVFAPYFEQRPLKKYKRRLRKIMSRLGHCRDLAVFRLKLDAFNAQVEQPLVDLDVHFIDRQMHADQEIEDYLNSPKQQSFLAKYRSFTETPGAGVKLMDDPWEPVITGHVAPVMIFQRVAIVRSFDDKLQGATLEQLHKLRIQFKELRYTLQFFAPLLGPDVQTALDHLKKIQDHLGDLNDATVALELLDEVNGLQASVDIYRAYQYQEIERLVDSFAPVWEEFNQPAWRHNLAAAVAVM